ncbi:MAG: hypothetical protein M3Y07_01820 [Acidobacteriota bacterium]|nr:hypothetical protein [Acidobacteriota bacterium]
MPSRSYQGTRFDWSGIVASLQYKGHEYFGQWYDRHDPKIHDAITGPVEEFLSNDAGLGYNEAKPGGTFVRIGVGVVRKPDEKGYRRFETYEIVEPGKRAMRSGPDWIEFTQELASDDGYAYVYRKQDAPVDQREARTGDRARAKEHRKKDHRHGAIQP